MKIGRSVLLAGGLLLFVINPILSGVGISWEVPYAMLIGGIAIAVSAIWTLMGKA